MNRKEKHELLKTIPGWEALVKREDRIDVMIQARREELEEIQADEDEDIGIGGLLFEYRQELKKMSDEELFE